MRSAVATTPEFTERDVLLFRRLARETAGISLGERKEALLRARLGKILRGGNYRTCRDYYRALVADHTGAALQEFLDAITTNKTEFFREPEHFDFLRTWAFDEGWTAPRIWCAACSSGEEAYTIAMTMAERATPPTRVDVLASDLSTRMLAIATRGVYREDRVAALGSERRRAFFLKGEGSSEGLVRVKPSLAAMVRFRHHNLLDPLAGEASFHAIFCRNVLIYFDREVQERILENLSRVLRPGGLIFLGHAESLAGLRTGLATIRPAIYRARGR